MIIYSLIWVNMIIYSLIWVNMKVSFVTSNLTLVSLNIIKCKEETVEIKLNFSNWLQYDATFML